MCVWERGSMCVRVRVHECVCECVHVCERGGLVAV